jgi:cyclic lactone autoinducer peptide
MRKVIKILLYSPLILMAIVVAGGGIGPASWLAVYQPAPPEK